MSITSNSFSSHRDLDVSKSAVVRSEMRLEFCKVDSLGRDSQLVVREGECRPASETG